MDIVTYVSQENYLFQKSIVDNMKMAKPDASIEEIQSACKKASCHVILLGICQMVMKQLSVSREIAYREEKDENNHCKSFTKR